MTTLRVHKTEKGTQGSSHQRLDCLQRYTVPVQEYVAKKEWQKHELFMGRLKMSIQPKGRNKRNKYKSDLDHFRQTTLLQLVLD